MGAGNQFDRRKLQVRRFTVVHAWLPVLGMLAMLTNSSPTDATSGVDPELKSKVSAGTENLAFRLLSLLAKSEPGKNVLISPTSVTNALTLTLNGAGGKTAQEMAQTLGLTGIPLNQINKAKAEAIKQVESADPGVQLLCANALWVRNGVTLKRPFADNAKNFFKAQAACLDFASPSAVPTINRWVAEKTKNKIDKIIEQLDKTSALVITNAVYLKGKWTNPFVLQRTNENGEFRTLNNVRLRLAMMQDSAEFSYADNANAQFIELPYGNARVVMYVILPRDEANYQKFVTSFTAADFAALVDNLTTQKVNLKLPRFSLSYGAVDLAQALKSLGMPTAFDMNKADFKPMADVALPLYIGQVLHKAIMDVNESGTEAAAATAVEMRFGSAPPMPTQKPINMTVDHPFIVAISERQSKELLFLASVVKPEKLAASK